jgi:type III restriction enzyme
VNLVVCDPQHDDADPEELWEYRAAAALDAHPKVLRFVKNDHLNFAIPYRYQTGDVSYVPDFLAVIACEDGRETTLVLEVKGWLHDQVAAKNASAQKWVDAVNAEGAWGRWAFAIVYRPEEVGRVIEHVVRSGQGGVVQLKRELPSLEGLGGAGPLFE